jgi:hypothetical protein
MAKRRVVTQWDLETEGASKGVKNLQANTKELFNSFTDLKSAWDMAYGVATKMGDKFDDLMSTGRTYSKMLDANTLSIDKAMEATSGLLTKMDVLQAANMATQMKLGLTEDSFAALAAGAVTASEKIGGDVNKALNDLITGISRKSKPILDNLGITFGEIAEGATFASTAIDKLNEITGGQGPKVKTAGDMWTVFKNRLSDTYSEVARLVGESAAAKGILGEMNMALGLMTGDVKAADDASVEWLKTLRDDLAPVLPPVADLVDQLTQSVESYKKVVDEIDHEKAAAAMGLLAFQEGGISTIMKNFYGKGAGWTGRPGVDVTGYATMGTSSKLGGPEWEAAKARRDARKKKKGGTGTGIPSAWFKEREQKELGLEFPATTPEQDAAASKHDWESAADGIAEISRQSQVAIEAQKKLGETVKTSAEIMKESYADLKEVGVSALAGLASGMWSAAEAAVTGSKSFGQAMGDMLQSVLMAVAKEATVLAAMETAKGVAAAFTPGMQAASIGHYQAAAMFGGVALLAGAAGLGMAAGGFGGSGGGETEKGEVYRGIGTGGSFGRTAEGDTTIHVHLEIPSAKSGASLFIGKQTLKTVVKKAA